jgi:hypothetical protein
LILPLVMSSVSRATSSPVNERGAGSGRLAERTMLARLIALDTLSPTVII